MSLKKSNIEYFATWCQCQELSRSFNLSSATHLIATSHCPSLRWGCGLTVEGSGLQHQKQGPLKREADQVRHRTCSQMGCEQVLSHFLALMIYWCWVFSLLSLVLTFISVLLENRKLLPDSTTPLHALACYSTSRRLFRQDSGDLSKISVTSRRPLPQENPSISTSSDSQINRSVEEQQYTASSHLIQSSKSFNTTPDQSLFQEKCTNPFFGQIDENRIDSTAYNDSGRSEANFHGYTSATSPRDV